MGHVVEAVDRNGDHARPLLALHAGESGVIMHAGVVHEDLDRSRLEHRFERREGCPCIDDVESHRAAVDVGRELPGGFEVAVSVHYHLEAVSRKTPADRRADRAAAAGDERAPSHRGNTTATRPSTSRRPADATSNRYRTPSSFPPSRSANTSRSPGTSSRRRTCTTTERTLASKPAPVGSRDASAPCAAAACAPY